MLHRTLVIVCISVLVLAGESEAACDIRMEGGAYARCVQTQNASRDRDRRESRTSAQFRELSIDQAASRRDREQLRRELELVKEERRRLREAIERLDRENN